MSQKRLLGVFAHPDDEGMIGGALLRSHAEGGETGLVYATRGEVGEIADPTLATPENLGEVREAEMHAAAELLNVNKLWFLGYRDSGMAGTADTQHSKAFMRTSAADVIGKLVAIIRQFRPHVMVTFDETGGYGHPDHIAIYQHTTGAFHAAADDVQYPELGPAYAVSKLYYASFSRRHIQMMAQWLEETHYKGVFQGVDIQQLGLADEQINVVLDVEPYQETKAHSWEQHRTQKNSNALLAELPEELQHKWRSTEFFQLATSRVGSDIVGENDLFARVIS